MGKRGNCEPAHRCNPAFFVALLGVFWSFLVLPVCAASLPDVIDKIRPSIVGVGTVYPLRQPNRKGDPVAYRGTGFVIGNGRQVITNAHVIPEKLDVDHNQSLAIFAGRGAKAKAYTARIVRTDKEHDLALLEIQGITLPAMQLGDSDTCLLYTSPSPRD